MPTDDIEVLSAENPEDALAWDRLVDSSATRDVYYRPGYVHASRRDSLSEALAIVFRSNGEPRCLVPLIRRSIRVSGDSQDISDTATPYGYGGVCALTTDFPRHGELTAVFDAVQGWAESAHINCCVIRLHPVFRQASWKEVLAFDDRVHFNRLSKTFALDTSVTNSHGSFLEGMSKGRRSDIAFGCKRLRISQTSPLSGTSYFSDLQTFQALYSDAMQRLNADAFLRFPPRYFFELSQALMDRIVLFIAWEGERAVGGALFMRDQKYAHYHLSALSDAGRGLKAGTLLIAAGADWAQRNGDIKLHLGGGLKDDDSLFKFKQSFGGEVFDYLVFTLVLNRTEFERIRLIPSAPWPYQVESL